MARPRKFDKEQVTEIKVAFEKYIADTEDPTVEGFLSYDPTALKLWVTKYNMDNYKEFSKLLERAIIKERAYLLSKGMKGQGTAMSIFRLKQKTHGFSDRFEQDITSKGEKITFTNAVPRPGASSKKK
jgi:hypothetical protein